MRPANSTATTTPTRSTIDRSLDPSAALLPEHVIMHMITCIIAQWFPTETLVVIRTPSVNFTSLYHPKQMRLAVIAHNFTVTSSNSHKFLLPLLIVLTNPSHQFYVQSRHFHYGRRHHPSSSLSSSFIIAPISANNPLVMFINAPSVRKRIDESLGATIFPE